MRTGSPKVSRAKARGSEASLWQPRYHQRRAGDEEQEREVHTARPKPKVGMICERTAAREACRSYVLCSTTHPAAHAPRFLKAVSKIQGTFYMTSCTVAALGHYRALRRSIPRNQLSS